MEEPAAPPLRARTHATSLPAPTHPHPVPVETRQVGIRLQVGPHAGATDRPATTATITASPTTTRGLTEPPDEQTRLTERHCLPPEQLLALLAARDVHELHIPDLAIVIDAQWLLDLLRTGQPLHRVVIETMQFDLTDVLDAQLAELVIVLTVSARTAGTGGRHPTSA